MSDFPPTGNSYGYYDEEPQFGLNEARAEITRLRDELAKAREAIDQALDDMGDDGHCVCPAAKDMLRAALAGEKP